MKGAEASFPVSFPPEVWVLAAPRGAAPAGAVHNIDHSANSVQRGKEGAEGQDAQDRARREVLGGQNDRFMREKRNWSLYTLDEPR